jgi:uncharacterized Zn finger protein (UPF0148 family)
MGIEETNEEFKSNSTILFANETEDGDCICQMCGKVFKSITPTHLKKDHDMTILQYKQDFPDARMVSKSKITKRSNSLRKNKLNDINETLNEFENERNKPIENIIEEMDDDIGNSIEIDDYNFGDDIDVKTKNDLFSDLKTNVDPITKIKSNIINKIKPYLNNIKSNFIIEQKSIRGNNLLFSHVTDFADPVKKVVIDFPGAFFHNQGRGSNELKYKTLKEYGWKIIIIKPSEDLESKLKIEFKK